MMNRVVYISDMDGTLLSSEGRVPEKTSEMLNKFINNGTLFTVATSRSVISAKELLQDINMNIPAVFMNGAYIYDLKNDKPVKITHINIFAVEKFIRLIKTKHVGFFVFYSNKDGTIETVFERLTLSVQKKFYEARREVLGDRLIHSVDEITINENVIYISLCETEEVIRPLFEYAQTIEGLNTVFYKDTYTDYYFLEVFSDKCSKGIGACFIKEYCGADIVTVFGDNKNDFALFECADVKVAVKNANTELLKRADFICESNDDSGVVRFIELDEKKE